MARGSYYLHHEVEDGAGLEAREDGDGELELLEHGVHSG